MLSKEEKELLGKGLLQDTEFSDVMDYFGAENIVREFDIEDLLCYYPKDDIVQYILDNEGLLDYIDDDVLKEAMTCPEDTLEDASDSDLIDELERRGWNCTPFDMSERAMLEELKDLCRNIEPDTLKTSEDMKSMLCDLIDRNIIKSFR